MELIKLGKDKYLVKNSNGKIINEKERLELEKNELILKDIEGCNCQGETTKKIKKIDKKLKKLENWVTEPALHKEIADEVKQETK